MRASRRLPRHRLRLGIVLGLLAAVAPPARAVDDAVKEQVRILEENARKPFEQDRRERALRELGRIGGRDAARAVLPLFEDPFVHLHDHAVSAWIAMLKGPQAAETQTWLTTQAIVDRQPGVRAGVATALGLTGGRELAEAVRVALGREKDGAVLRAWAEAALRLRGEPQLDGVFGKYLRHKDGGAVFSLAQAAARFDGQGAVKSLLGTLRHADPRARAGAVLALQSLDALPDDAVEAILADKAPDAPMALAESIALRTRALPWPGAGAQTLERLLARGDWRVRAAAIQGALRVWEPGIVDLLIARLAPETGRLHDDVRRALETFTGQRIGSDPELWTAWWRQRRGDFDAGPRPEPDRAGNIRFRAGGEADPREGTRTVAFFDLPLRSKRLAFVFDLSGSMGNAAARKGEEGPTKLDLLRGEFERTLAALDADTLFDVFVYRYWSSYPPKTKLTRALGRLQPCTPGATRKARGWLAKQEAKGWGAFYEPLEAVLAEDVDTVILLSDGRPSRGRYDRDTRLLAEFPHVNRFRRVAVNTVLVGEKGADRKFMQALADATGGRFQEVKGR